MGEYNGLAGIWTSLLVPVWSVKRNLSVVFNVILIKFALVIVVVSAVAFYCVYVI